MRAKDPSNVYRKTYYDNLNDQISVVSGLTIPVYDVVPANAVAPYIILSSTNLTPNNTNLNYGFSASIVLDVVTRFKAGGGKKLVDDIANKIFDKVYTNDDLLISDDWKITATQLDNTKYLESESTGGYVIRKLITFSNYIQQIGGAE